VIVNAQTVIVSKSGTLKFGDLKTGSTVSVAGTKQADGSIIAVKIEVQ
jgi:hypothetical protein